MNKVTITDAERIKRLLFGSLRYRFSVLLITSGVFLVGGETGLPHYSVHLEKLIKQSFSFASQ